MIPGRVSNEVRRLNPHVFGSGAAMCGTQSIATQKPAAGANASREADMQQACERMLEAGGYKRLTPTNAERCAELPYLKGWFAHIARAPGNPFLPDLVIMAVGRPPLLVELKARERFGRGQMEMISGGWWSLCRSAAEFANLLHEWEDRKGTP